MRPLAFVQNKTLHPSSLFIVCWAMGALMCGGASGRASDIDPDGSLDATVGDVEADAESGSAEDARATADIDLPFTVIDGGTECDAMKPMPCCRETRTCCNGEVCEGLCVAPKDGGNPFCYCAGSKTGCPNPSVCCGIWLPEAHGTCLSSCPKLGPP